MMRYIFRPIYYLILTVLSFVFLILLTEVIFKLFKLSKLSIISADQQYGWTLQKNMNLNVYTHGHSINITSNSDGFRNLQSSSKDNKILLLGDSYLAGRQVDDSELFSTYLNQRGINVLNYGIPAWSTDQQIMLLMDLVKNESFEKVVLLFSPNDIRENYAKNFITIKNNSLEFIKFNRLKNIERLKWKLAGISYTYNYLSKINGWSEGSFNSILGRYYTSNASMFSDADLYKKQISSTVEKAYMKTSILLRNLKKISGEKLVILLIPTKYPIHFKSDDPNRVENWLREFCITEEIEFYSMQNIVNEEIENEFFYDLHYTPRGHELVGKRMYDILKSISEKDSQLIHQSPDSP